MCSPKAAAGTLVFSAAYEAAADTAAASARKPWEPREPWETRDPQKERERKEQSQDLKDRAGVKFVGLEPEGTSWTSKVGQGVCTAAQKTKEFEQKHQVTARAAGATKASFRAAYEANQKYGVTEKIGQGVTTAAKKSVEFEQRHHVTQRAAEAARSTVNAARGANERYGITEKIGSGAKTAYSKAREFDEKHQVTSKTASGLKSGVSHLASAPGAAAGATSKASKNPFGAPQTPPSPERASAQKNPFRGTGNPFVR